MKTLKAIWADPVWSKVIAGAIIGIVGFAASLIFVRFGGSSAPPSPPPKAGGDTNAVAAPTKAAPEVSRNSPDGQATAPPAQRAEAAPTSPAGDPLRS